MRKAYTYIRYVCMCVHRSQYTFMYMSNFSPEYSTKLVSYIISMHAYKLGLARTRKHMVAKISRSESSYAREDQLVRRGQKVKQSWKMIC